MNTITILDGSGDTKLTWDAQNADEVDAIRATVATMKAQGYAFFLIDGTPADEVAAGQGNLVVRRVNAEALLPAEAAPALTLTPESPAVPVADAAAIAAPVKAVAVRRMAGG